jgi:hypothetical protein
MKRFDIPDAGLGSIARARFQNEHEQEEGATAERPLRPTWCRKIQLRIGRFLELLAATPVLDE